MLWPMKIFRKKNVTCDFFYASLRYVYFLKFWKLLSISPFLTPITVWECMFEVCFDLSLCIELYAMNIL